jgi:hypothetical protein
MAAGSMRWPGLGPESELQAALPGSLSPKWSFSITPLESFPGTFASSRWYGDCIFVPEASSEMPVFKFSSLSRGALAATGAASVGASLPQGHPDRRKALFREILAEKCERIALGAVWSLQPKRVDRILPLARHFVSYFLEPDPPMPDLTRKPEVPELVGIASDLKVPILVEAYGRGLFPHCHFGPEKWLSPPERCVLFFDEFHMSKRLKRLMRQGRYSVTFDCDFEGVIKACAGRREGRWHLTWITPRIMLAYAELTTRAMCIPLRCGIASENWSAAGMASRSAACSSPNPSFRSSRTRRSSASPFSTGWRDGATR